jgi:hypothetical protein
MGLLDDAIREHLELKRRRGADPAELEQAEHEALGPVRRKESADVAAPGPDAYDEAPTGVAAAGADVYEDEEFAYHDADADWPEEDDRLPTGASEGRGRGGAPELADDPQLGYGAYEEDRDAPSGRGWRRGPRTNEPPLAPPPPPAANRDVEDSETAEYHLHEELPEEDGDDMLEETPEFLQDTPDHDRLWFEQRPPRDFDFDG